MTHNSTHPDRRLSIGEQQAKRERDQAIADFQRLERERDEALDEVERLRLVTAQRDELAAVVRLMLEEYENAMYGSDYEDRAVTALAAIGDSK